MVFVTADSCRIQLERLSRLLVSAFPGSTIYQHTAMLRVPHDVLNNRVDVVLLEAEADQTNGLDVMNMLHRQKPNVPVFILTRTEAFRRQAVDAGASGCFVLPDGEEQLLEAIRMIKNEEHAS